jgi:copper chaperone CopZ
MAVQPGSTYIHALDGRLRVKGSGVKGVPRRALEIEAELRAIDGIDHVKANPITGNILILYRPDRIDQDQILSALGRLGCLQAHETITGNSGGELQGFSAILTETLVRSTVELALQRLVSALI